MFVNTIQALRANPVGGGVSMQHCCVGTLPLALTQEFQWAAPRQRYSCRDGPAVHAPQLPWAH